MPFSMTWAIADINAASPATAATRDCVSSSAMTLWPLKCAAPSLKATLSASPLAKNAETNAVQEATLLFIALAIGLFGCCDKLNVFGVAAQ